MIQQQASRKLSNVSVDNHKGPTRPEDYLVLEVDPWIPPSDVQKAIDSMIERQFLLSPWVREKRMRNQIRLILKDHLEAGPERRSTSSKIVYDAYNMFHNFRNQIRVTMFENWDQVQKCEYADAARIIFQEFKHHKLLEESLKYTEEMGLEFISEHMIEVGQFLKRKAAEKAAKSGKESKGSITNSKFWYEVRKKINEIMEQKKVHQRKSSTEESEEDNPFMFVQKGYYQAAVHTAVVGSQDSSSVVGSQDSSSSNEENSENGD